MEDSQCMSNSDSSCDWVVINEKTKTDEVKKDITGNKSESQNHAVADELGANGGSRVEELLENDQNVDCHSGVSDDQCSDVDVLDDSDSEPISSSFPVDQLKMTTLSSDQHSENVPDEMIQSKTKECQTDVNIAQPKPPFTMQNIDWKNYLMLTVVVLLAIGCLYISGRLKSNEIIQGDLNTQKILTDSSGEEEFVDPRVLSKNGDKMNKFSDDSREPSKEAAELNILKMAYEDIAAWKNKFQDLFEENAHLKDVLMASLHSDKLPPGKATHNDENQPDEPNQDSEKVITEQSNDDILFLKNQLNEIQTENEEMKQTIGKLRYVEISTMRLLMEQHSSIINDLRNENNDLRKMIAHLRYSKDQQGQSSCNAQHHVESEADKLQRAKIVEEIKLAMTDLKKGIEVFKVEVCHDKVKCREMKSDGQSIESALDEVFNGLENVTNHVVDPGCYLTKLETLDMTLKAIIYINSDIHRQTEFAQFWLSLISDLPNPSHDYYYEQVKDSLFLTLTKSQQFSEIIFKDGILNEVMQPKKQKTDQDSTNSEPGLFDQFSKSISKYLDSTNKAIREELSSVWDSSYEHPLIKILNSTREALASATDTLKKKLDNGRSKLDGKFVNEAYERMTSFMQNTIHKVKKKAQEFADFNEMPDASIKDIKSVLQKFKENWKNKLRKNFQSHEEERETEDEKSFVGDGEKESTWNIERSRNREKLRDDEERDWFIKRGEERRHDSYPSHDVPSKNKKHFNTKRK